MDTTPEKPPAHDLDLDHHFENVQGKWSVGFSLISLDNREKEITIERHEGNYDQLLTFILTAEECSELKSLL